MNAEPRLTGTGALSEEGHTMLRLQRLNEQVLGELQEQTRLLKEIYGVLSGFTSPPLQADPRNRPGYFPLEWGEKKP